MVTSNRKQITMPTVWRSSPEKMALTFQIRSRGLLLPALQPTMALLFQNFKCTFFPPLRVPVCFWRLKDDSVCCATKNRRHERIGASQMKHGATGERSLVKWQRPYEPVPHRLPIAATEVANHRQFRTMGRQYVRSEAGLCAESCGSPVLEDVIGRARRSGQLRRENPYHCIRTLGEIRRARDDHRRPDLGFLGADQNADHHIARPQSRSSDSSASRRRRDAALKSFRSSSDQESDQSILWFGASSANRSASADSSVAASGGKRRKASTNEASRSFLGVAEYPPAGGGKH